jgi:16S rRNA (cytosine1402-N4)-methyltransferase
VLKDEVLFFLKPKSNENFIDCTTGLGGHTEAILKKTGPKGKVLGFEWDEELYGLLKEKETERFIPVNESYTLLEETVKEKNFSPVSGVLFDLGFSSFHVDRSGRGFSFRRRELLDMRYNKNNPLTAFEIVNHYKEKDLFYILKKWGEEDFAKQIAERIVLERKKRSIESTLDLASIVEEVIPKAYSSKQKIHCATKTFQALRIAVNGELLGLKAALPQALSVMEAGGRLVVICFHGGEEEIVRNFFRSANIKLLTEEPIKPTTEEIKKNIRSRSAKLYAAIKK